VTLWRNPKSCVIDRVSIPWSNSWPSVPAHV